MACLPIESESMVTIELYNYDNNKECLLSVTIIQARFRYRICFDFPSSLCIILELIIAIMLLFFIIVVIIIALFSSSDVSAHDHGNDCFDDDYCVVAVDRFQRCLLFPRILTF